MPVKRIDVLGVDYLLCCMHVGAWHAYMSCKRASSSVACMQESGKLHGFISAPKCPNSNSLLVEGREFLQIQRIVALTPPTLPQ